MRCSTLFAAGLLLAPSAALACVPEFVDTAETVTIDGVRVDVNQVQRQTFNVRVRGEGGSPCPATIRISRLSASGMPDLPEYEIRSGGRDIEILPVGVTVGTAESDVSIANAPSGPQGRTVPFQLVVPTEWGLRAGDYSEQLQLSLFDASGREVDTLRLTLNIAIPRTASLRIVGATGTNDVSRIDLGDLTRTGANTSDPFGVRIWSTSAYAVSFSSANRGSLVHRNGRDRIPYALTIDRQPLNLAAGDQQIVYSEYTGSLGRLHPLAVTAGPITAARAGAYNDRVTVTVTAI